MKTQALRPARTLKIYHVVIQVGTPLSALPSVAADEATR